MHPDSGKVVYAGVYDYSSPSPEMAYLPQWMMEHLGAGEGDEMIFEHVELPKGTLIRLQPISSTWLVSSTPFFLYPNSPAWINTYIIVSLSYCVDLRTTLCLTV